MDTSDAKGPSGGPEKPAARAAHRLDAYERAARAALAGRGELQPAPAAQLTDGELAALFAPRQAAALVAPLAPGYDCGEPQGAGP